MSELPIPVTQPENDPLLAALRQLPSHAMAGAIETRLQRQARAAYLRSFYPDSRSAWDSPAIGFVGRAAVPLCLAGIVGLYMSWAISTASMFFQ